MSILPRFLKMHAYSPPTVLRGLRPCWVLAPSSETSPSFLLPEGRCSRTPTMQRGEHFLNYTSVYSHFTDEVTEAQRGRVVFPRSHSQGRESTRLKSWPDSKPAPDSRCHPCFCDIPSPALKPSTAQGPSAPVVPAGVLSAEISLSLSPRRTGGPRRHTVTRFGTPAPPRTGHGAITNACGWGRGGNLL